jgi:hypothetical protein
LNKNNNPYSKCYNPGWRSHPNFSWSNAQNQQKAPAVPPGFATQSNSQLGAILKSFMQETKNFTAEAKSQILSQGVSIKNLENQVGQIATALTQRPSGSLPSTTETPASTSKDKGKETCKVITLRSGTEYEGPSMGTIINEEAQERLAEDSTVTLASQQSSPLLPQRSQVQIRHKSHQQSRLLLPLKQLHLAALF